ncbi:hypothetical protein V1290_001503 [Bradyrhizobium sp. AZCC 1578]|uniref:hypothetical protein n=1 Tax=Bradyrhizobium sp. AZCC 1578 TaxID=3117027 RepID=UPI002FF23FDB
MPLTSRNTEQIPTRRIDFTGVSFNAAGVGLANFIDNTATNNAVANPASASTLLRTQASVLGAILSIVQIRHETFPLEKKNPGMKKSTEGENLGSDVNSIRT